MRGAWLYALMARLLKPLPGDVSSTMRQLYRQSCIMRFVLVDKYITIKNINEIKSGNKCGPLEKHVSAIERGISVSEDDFECKLGVLNTIIVITGLYFGQGEDFAQLSDT